MHKFHTLEYTHTMKFMKEKTVIGLGVLLILLPLTGFPRSWKTSISFIIGIGVMYMGLLFFRTARNNETVKKNNEIKTETFTETA